MAFDETVLAGTTGWTIGVLMRDSSAGLPKTGIDAADVQFSYVRAGGTAPSEWYELSSSTWQELSSTYAPGLYRLTVPNEAIASGADAVTLFISTSGALPRCLRIGLINANLRDATRLGLSALPNAAAGSSGGLPTVDANNAVKLQAGSGANQILLNEGKVTVGAMNSNVITASAIQDNAITASKIASAAITSAKFAADAIDSSALAASAATEISAAVWDRQTSALTVTGSVGKRVADNVDATISSRSTFNPSSQTVTVGAMNSNTITSAAIQDNAITANKIATDAIQASKIQDGAITANKIAAGAITAAKFAADAIDSAALAASAATEVAAAVWDRLTSAITTAGSIGKYLLDKIVGTIADGTHHPQSGDSYERLGTPATGTIAADIASVRQDTAALEGRLTADRAQYLDNLNVSGTLAHTGNADTFKADVSNLATSSQVNNVQAEVEKLTEMTQTTGTPTYRRFKQEALEMTPAAGLTPQQAAQLANADAMATEWDGMVVNGVFTAAALQNSPVGTGGFTTDDRALLNEIHEKTRWITAGVVAISSPLDADMNLQVIAGDSYSVTWSSPDWPDLTGSTITLILQSGGQQHTVTATRTGNQVTAVVTPSLTRSLAGQMWAYSLRAVISPATQYTLAHGQVIVRSVPLGG